MLEKVSEYLFIMLEFILIWNKIYSTIRNKSWNYKFICQGTVTQIHHTEE